MNVENLSINDFITFNGGLIELKMDSDKGKVLDAETVSSKSKILIPLRTLAALSIKKADEGVEVKIHASTGTYDVNLPVRGPQMDVTINSLQTGFKNHFANV